MSLQGPKGDESVGDAQENFNSKMSFPAFCVADLNEGYFFLI